MKRSARNLAGLTEKSRTGEVEIGGHLTSEVHASAKTCLRPAPPLASMRFILSRAPSRGLGLWYVAVAFFHAPIQEVVFARPPENMRKEQHHLETLESHVRDTGCKFTLAKVGARNSVQQPLGKFSQVYRVLLNNENEDSLVTFHGEDFLAEGHDSSLNKLDEVLGAFEMKRLPRIGPTAGREEVFLHKTTRWNESGFSYRPDPKHVDALIATLSVEDARPVATPFTRDTKKGQANTLSELSVTEKAIYMSGLQSVATHCTGQNGRGVCYERGEIANSAS